jgi:hypothetical protein
VGLSHRSIAKSVKADKELSPANGDRGGAPEAVDGGTVAADDGLPWTAEADFEALKAPSFLAGPAKPPALVKVVARKPKSQEFIRTRPGDAWRGIYGVVRDQRSDTSYVVAPALYHELADELVTSLVVVAVNTAAEAFLWAVPLGDASGRVNPWWESALEGARRAESVWVRLKPDQQAGRYDLREAAYPLPEPQWPAATFGELFRVAYKDLVIASLEHPLVRKLRGAI